METKTIEVEAFVVKGLELKGTVAMIPAKWDELNATMADKGIRSDDSFGVCVRMDEHEFHYIAGIHSALAEGLSNTAEVLIPGGKYIVASVKDGVHAIPATFNELMKREEITFRHSYAIEHYIHPEGSVGYEIEVWLPID